VSKTSWSICGELTLPAWIEYGKKLGSLGRSSGWWIGDWLRYGNAAYGERYTRAARVTGYDTQTLMNMVYVASRFEISRRRENLSWSHHEALASLDPGAQDRWLDEAIAKRLSVSDLRTMLRTERREVHDSAIAAGTGDELPQVSSDVVQCPRCGEEISLE